MPKELNKNLLSSINIGAEIMVHSLAAHVTMSKIPKKKLTKQQARDNYCKSVLFLWGFMQYDFENVDEDMFYRCQMVSANILFKVLSRKEFESLYLGAGLNKRKSKDPPKLVKPCNNPKNLRNKFIFLILIFSFFKFFIFKMGNIIKRNDTIKTIFILY